MGVKGNLGRRYLWYLGGTQHFSSPPPTPSATEASTPILLAEGARASQKLVGSGRRFRAGAAGGMMGVLGLLVVVVAVVVVVVVVAAAAAAVFVAKSDRYGTSTTVATITNAGGHGTHDQSWTYWVCPIQNQACTT